VFRSVSRESSNHCASVLRDSVRQSQQRYSTAELYKPQTSRRRSPSMNLSIESHEWYDWCDNAWTLDIVWHELISGIGAVQVCIMIFVLLSLHLFISI